MRCLIVLVLATVAHAAPQFRFLSPISTPTVLPSGHLADTPEVAAAKVAHFTEHAKALALAPPSPVVPLVRHYVTPAVIPYYRRYYSGPFAIPTVLPDGHLADTPKVAAAKAFHFNEYAKALTRTTF